MPNLEKALRFNSLFKGADVKARLEMVANFSAQAVFETNLSREDQFLLWAVHTQQHSISIVAPQIAAMTAEQRILLDVTKERYGATSVSSAAPICTAKDFAILSDPTVRLTSRTKETFGTQEGIKFVVWDHQNRVMIFNPLADMTVDDVEAEIFAHEIPVNLPPERTAVDDKNIAQGMGFNTLRENLSPQLQTDL